MKAAWITLAALLVVAIGGASKYYSVKNDLVTQREAVNAQWSNVDVVLQRRADLIPNLVETVKGVAKQESTIFISIADADLLRRLLLDSLSTFCVLFRHALRLHGVDCPTQKREVIRRCAGQFGIDPQPFERLLDVREERVKPRDVEPVGLLSGYLEGIARVIEAVDRLEK